MNLNEIARITIPPLPSASDRDQTTINRKLIDTIKLLYQRDQDKEVRLRALRDDIGSGITLGGLLALNMPKRLTSADSPYTVTDTDQSFHCDTSGGNIVINLKLGVNGKKFTIRNTRSMGNNVTVNAAGGQRLLGYALPLVIADNEIFDFQFETTEGWS